MNQPSEKMLEYAEQHVAYDGNVDLTKWVDTSQWGFKITLGLSNRAQLDFFDGVMTMRKNRGGQRYQAVIAPFVTTADGERSPDMDDLTQQEWQFCGRGWSESKGAHIALHIGDIEAIEFWRGQTASDQVESKRGAMFYVLLLELEDDETIVNQQKRDRVVPVKDQHGGPRSRKVGMMLSDPDFQEFLKHSIYASNEDPFIFDDPKKVDQLIKRVCAIESKKQFDVGVSAESHWEIFETQFQRPFIQYMQRSSGQR